MTLHVDLQDQIWLVEADLIGNTYRQLTDEEFGELEFEGTGWDKAVLVIKTDEILVSSGHDEYAYTSNGRTQRGRIWYATYQGVKRNAIVVYSSEEEEEEVVPLKKKEEKKKPGRPPTPIQHNLEALEWCLTAPIEAFRQFGETKQTPNGIMVWCDHGADVLAVAHLDSVAKKASFSLGSQNGKDVIRSPWLDDRLGAYIILYVLPAMGIKVDVLLTEGEETGRSTAQFFNKEGYEYTDKQYNWMVEFDRTGKTTVMYEYHTEAMETALTEIGFDVAWGSFTDICKLDHLGIWGMNVGVGYYNYHSDNAYAVIDEMDWNLQNFRRFYKKNRATLIAHDPANTKKRWANSGNYRVWTGTDYEDWSGYSSSNYYTGKSYTFQPKTTNCQSCGHVAGVKYDLKTNDWCSSCRVYRTKEDPYEGMCVCCGLPFLEGHVCGEVTTHETHDRPLVIVQRTLKRDWMMMGHGKTFEDYMNEYIDGKIKPVCIRCEEKFVAMHNMELPVCTGCASDLLEGADHVEIMLDQYTRACSQNLSWFEWVEHRDRMMADSMGETYHFAMQWFTVQERAMFGVRDVEDIYAKLKKDETQL